MGEHSVWGRGGKGSSPFTAIMKMNWKAIGVWSIALVAIVAASQMSGCTLGDIIPVDVPEGVQAVTGAPESVSLSETDFVREDFVTKTVRDLERFDANVADARFWEDIGLMLLNTGYEAAVPYLGTIPAGGVLLTLLGAIGGRYLKRPGEDARVDAAWDEASEVTRKTILEALGNGNPTPQHS